MKQINKELLIKEKLLSKARIKKESGNTTNAFGPEADTDKKNVNIMLEVLPNFTDIAKQS